MESRTTTPMMFDEFALKHGGMLATNGHSLYKSRDVIMDCLDHILECTHTSQHPITIADVGTSDGSTSAALLNEVIGKIQCHTGKSRQLMIYYTDQQTNDFNRMFNVINAGLNIGPKVFCAAVGRTMFEQCLPDKSTDLIFSAIATFYLSKSPCKIQDGLNPTKENSKEMDAFNSQAASDWKTFLVMRGRELRPGGYLVVLSIGTTKQGEVSVPIKGGYNTLSHVIRNLLADDIITKEEFLDCNLNAELYRTEEAYALPFRDNAKDLSETGLELVSTRSFVHKLDHPSFAVYNKDDATKKVYADRIVAGIKPWLYGYIYNGLSCTRSQQERESLVEIYFSMLWDFAYKNDNQTPQLGLIEVVARKRV
ncbi:benzoate carboxyl methyltransferase-like [Mizuhopecten yessoensis]|uniref:Gibberellic acid methyltransferase 2 n=1 Tax=Mizuhopecten yessoensis TaxID=6573 RepID=A0A210QYU6_MIZYE|nr:benzoate carboxyl methyltransferase-like [Mizuhopecten yessoensis]OWF53841.1 Gibberellic acid methyltransferase 2 [Mizuhopecten yessoensis]